MKKNLKFIRNKVEKKLCCKKCSSVSFVRSGKVGGKQRYRCKMCGCNFTEGDGRTKTSTSIKKALAILLYATGRTSFRRIAKLLDVDHSLVYRWIRDAAESLPEPAILGDLSEVEFDEMWHFVKFKKTNSGLSKRWTVVQGEPLHGLQVVVMLRHSKDCTKNLNT